jgi:4-hydroxy 2-oxovalerate aldolase
MINLRGLEVIDCTLRDGGFQNGWWFDREFAKDYVRALSAAGIRIVELGYFTRAGVYPDGKYGPWRHLTEDFLREMCEDADFVPCAMGEGGRFDAESIPDRSKSLLQVFRVSSYWHPDQLEEAVKNCRILKDKGYFVTLNLVAASTRSAEQIQVSLKHLADAPADVVYLVDTFGAFTPSQVTSLAGLYRSLLPGIQLGLHAHNNRQLAIANSLAAIDAGARFFDCTLRGMGRGAGNCPIEAFLGLLDDPAFSVLPILRCLDKWSAHIPVPTQLDVRYLLTGVFNRHQKLVQQDSGSLEEFYHFLNTTEHSDSHT